MTRNEMIRFIRRAVKVAGRPPSALTVRLGMDVGTTKEEAVAVLVEAMKGG